MISFVFYAFTVFLSHYVYKYFKAETQNGQGGFANMFGGAGGGAQQIPVNNNQNYDRMNEERQN